MASHYYAGRGRRGWKRSVITEYVLGVTVEFHVTGGVFSAKRLDEGTRLLLENILVEDGARVLDVGCGYGAIGITIAKAYPRTIVYMVDINPQAVKLAKLNARINGVENRVHVLQGDLYQPVKGLVFDTIVSNPPLAAGWNTISRIIQEAPRHLSRGGLLQMVFRKGENKAISLMETTGFEIAKTIRKRGYTVIIARKN